MRSGERRASHSPLVSSVSLSRRLAGDFSFRRRRRFSPSIVAMYIMTDAPRASPKRDGPPQNENQCLRERLVRSSYKNRHDQEFRSVPANFRPADVDGSIADEGGDPPTRRIGWMYVTSLFPNALRTLHNTRQWLFFAHSRFYVASRVVFDFHVKAFPTNTRCTMRSLLLISLPTLSLHRDYFKR